MQKNILNTLTLLVFSAFLVAGQNYKPFQASVSKRFVNVNQATDDAYFFYADSITQAGGSTLFYNYRPIIEASDFEFNEECPFWGALGVTHYLDTNRFTGNYFVFDETTQRLKFWNRNGAELNLDFSLAINDSAQVYQDATSLFFIKRIADSEQSFWGFTDSIRQFLLLHYDNLGGPTGSSLDQFVIKLSQNHGLLSFFSPYNIPDDFVSLELIGQTNPPMGNYSIRTEEMYPYQAGDILQYLGVNYGLPYGEGWRLTSYEVINREEVADSVKIDFSYFGVTQPHSFGFNPGNWGSYGYYLPNPLRFHKNDFWLKIPFNHLDYGINNRPVFHSQTNELFCGEARDGIFSMERFVNYCPDCYCIGQADGFGSYVSRQKAAKGIGVIWGAKDPYNYPNQVSSAFNLSYAKIGPFECGTRQYQNFENLTEMKWILFPNPVGDFINIELDSESVRFRLLDISGNEMDLPFPKKQNSILTFSIEKLSPGIYYLYVETNDGVLVRSLIKI
jgi:hypothetical protein